MPRLTPLWDYLPRGTPVALAIARRTGEVAVVDSDGECTFLDTRGRPLWSRRLPARPRDLALAAAGNRLAALCEDGTVLLLQTRPVGLGARESDAAAGSESGASLRPGGAPLLERRMPGCSTLSLSSDGAELFLGGRGLTGVLLHGPGLHPVTIEDAGPCALARLVPGTREVLTVSPVGVTRLMAPEGEPTPGREGQGEGARAGARLLRWLGVGGRTGSAGRGGAPAGGRAGSDTESYVARWRLELGAGVVALALAEGGARIVVAAQTEGAYVFTREPGPVERLDLGSPLYHVAVDAKGETIVAAAFDGRVVASDPGGARRWEYDTGGKDPLLGLSGAGDTLVVTAPGGYVKCLSVGELGEKRSVVSFLEEESAPVREEVAPLWTRPVLSGLAGPVPADVRVGPDGRTIYLAAEAGVIRAFDSRGAETRSLPFPGVGPRLAPEILPGRLVACSGDRIVLYDLNRGGTREVVSRGGVRWITCLAGGGPNCFLVVDDVGRVLCHDAEGNRRWEHTLGAVLGGVRLAPLRDGTAVAFAGERVAAFGTDGRSLWTLHGVSPTAERCTATPDLAVAASSREVAAFDAAGRERWRQELPGAPAGLYALGASVVVTLEDGGFLVFKPTGQPAAGSRLGEGIHRPALDREGRPALVTMGAASLSLAGLDGVLRWRLPLPSPTLAWDVDATGRFLALLCEGTLAYFVLHGPAPDAGAGRFLEV
ncbi:MAG: hypothetical protein HYZ53_20620 [Planctomycetes bacterium]|nr:hypothetical protein [Planctomycetota bacterium]